MIVKIIGGAPFAVSIILTIFMGGLGLGSYLASRIVDRIRQPARLVRIYGVLELVIGGYGLILPWLIVLCRPFFALLYNQFFSHFMLYSALTFVGCALLLIIPVTCMGATLPILCRFYVTGLSHLGTRTGRLYGLNTIGAAAGALLTGFWLLSLLGMWGSLAVAVLINSAIGLACIGVARRVHLPYRAPAEQTELRNAESPVESRYKGTAVYWSLIVFAVSGFCAMAYEVIWTKLLALIVGPTTYSFTIVLVTFILGLALGSLLFGWLADRTGKPALILFLTQTVAAASALAVSQLLGNSQLFFAKLIASYQADFTLRAVYQAAILFLFMLVPTLCLGAAFPTVSKVYTRSAERLGRSVGVAYAINTAGAVVGAFFAGFLLVPLVGKGTSLSIIIGLQLAIALGLFGILAWQRAERQWIALPAAVTGLAALVLCSGYPSWNPHLFAIGKYHRFDETGVDKDQCGWWDALWQGREILNQLDGAKVVYYGDGVAGTTAVLESHDALGNVKYTLYNSGKPDASNRGDMPTQTVCSHFAMLFHAEPKDVMVLGLASGVTAGEVLYYPIDRLDVIEISSEVVEASDFFLPWNSRVLADPRTHLIIQDGRAHLTLTDRTYDVIISEPSNPWMAGLATLFTRDFFSTAYDRLNESGIFVQFIHSYQMDWPTFSLVGRTFADVFANSLLIGTAPLSNSSDFYLVGMKGAKPINFEDARNRVSHTNRSPNVYLPDSRLLSRLIVSEDLHRLFGDGRLNTDMRPRLEFSAPKLMFEMDAAISRNISTRWWLSPATAEIVREMQSDVEAQIEFVAYLLSVHAPYHAQFPRLLDYEKATAGQRRKYFDLIDSYCSVNAPLVGDFRDDTTRRHCALSQIESLEGIVDTASNPLRAVSYLATLCSQEKLYDRLAAAYAEWVNLEPANPAVRSNLGHALLESGRIREGIENFQAALALDPGNALILFNLGIAWGRSGNLDSAVNYLERAVQNDPHLAEAHCKLGLSLLMQGKQSEAISHLKRALQIKPNYDEARTTLERALSM
jgi:spermidine synthase